MKLEPAGSTRQGSVNNRIRGRFNAWLFEALDDYMHARLGPAKTRLFAGVPGTVVEIGPGSGANLRYLPRGTHVIAIEPNIQMHERAAGFAEVTIEHLVIPTVFLPIRHQIAVVCTA